MKLQLLDGREKKEWNLTIQMKKMEERNKTLHISLLFTLTLPSVYRPLEEILGQKTRQELETCTKSSMYTH